jgi:hypothetical protein
MTYDRFYVYVTSEPNKTEVTISHKPRGVVLYIISPYCLFQLLGLTFLE